MPREKVDQALALRVFRAVLISASASMKSIRQFPNLHKTTSFAFKKGSVAIWDTETTAARDAALAALTSPRTIQCEEPELASATAMTAVSYSMNSGASFSAFTFADGTNRAFSTENPKYWLAAQSDANAVKQWGKLWSDIKQPIGMNGSWCELKEQLQEDYADWSFWFEWYERILDGDPMNWDLIFKIATEISDEDWDAGQARVAERIDEIKAVYLSDKTRLQETVELNPETGLTRVVTAEDQNPRLISALLSRVEDYLDDALSGNNGLTERSREVTTLRRTIAKHGNDPQRMELDFTSVSKSLRRLIHETGELANSEDNLALLDATEEGARGIRANHPEIAENRLRIAQQALSEMPREDLEFLEEAQPLLVALSEGELAEDFARDIPQLINDALTPLPSGAPPLPGADEATRIFYRTSRMAALYKRYGKTVVQGASIFDSDAVKSIRLVGVCGSAVAVLYQIVLIGLRAFGVL